MRWSVVKGRKLTANQAALLVTVALAVGYVVLREWSLIPALPCPFRWLTGIRCPLCGTTSTLHALLHGEAGVAMGFNPLITIVFIVSALAALAVLAQALLGRSLRLGLSGRGRKLALAALVGAVALNWAYVLLR